MFPRSSASPRSGAEMRIAVLHGEIAADAGPDEQDTFVEVISVVEVLEDLGNSVITVPCSLDLEGLEGLLRRERPDLVFNLVESLDGAGSLIHLVPSLVEHMRIPMTGASAAALFATSNKLLSKRVMELRGIPVPAAADERALGRGDDPIAGPVVIKSVWEHASVGLDDSSVVVRESAERLLDELEERRRSLGGSWFAEVFVDGREFNLSVIELDGRAKVLPQAEIEFVGYPEGKPRLVGYSAKWEPESFEYTHTVRRFAFPAEDRILLERLDDLALSCFEIFELSGYARVDFRVDPRGEPWVLEVNANPCISPDSGMVAAARKAGIDYPSLVERIVASATGRRQGNRKTARAPSPPKVFRGRRGAGPPGLVFRESPTEADREGIGRIVGMTGHFSPEEEASAVELAQERIDKGEAAGYSFVLADLDGSLVGYACYGKAFGSLSSWDLYWIAVDPAAQGSGVGTAIISRVVDAIRAHGGRRIYAETSGRPLYRNTRRFYEDRGFALAASLEGFYGAGDDKLIYELRLPAI